MLHLIPAPLHRVLYRVADRLRSYWWRVAKLPLQGAAVIATDLQDQLLLVRLSYGSGGWNLPTGGIGRGEDPADAARRELLEETGCEAHSLTLLGVQEDILHGTENRVYVYTAKTSGQPAADMREVIDARFFPMHSLPEPLTKTTRRRLALLRESSKKE
ncbi:NUDIX domain-containing protein [Pontixanthobacter gangjinensis]|uniref:NUDIX domain-containing protein n=1 Tax=Pontixanthobacter gangjinensis TaxID=1028742 RepID=A0A6I4SKM0_9SPHN|nr:NUDIX domain-containing protein [Pontixanthobacter gangjinensis]MXO56204.1 NUDIX domain-containing protein [Pontixanthobacter gangjinensis]